MLESSGFDYRNRYPQKYLFKIGRKMEVPKETIKIAYNIMLDLYKTFAPLKLTSAAMSLSCLELALRLSSAPSPRTDAEKNIITPTSPSTSPPLQTLIEKVAKVELQPYKCSRAQIMEGMLDLLDLYTHFQKATKVGMNYSIQNYVDIRIVLNQEAERDNRPRHTQWRILRNGFNKGLKTPKTPTTPASPSDARVSNGMQQSGLGAMANGGSATSPPSPKSSGSGRRARHEGTIRFVLDANEAKKEKRCVQSYFQDEWEEVEVEVEEKIMVTPKGPSSDVVRNAPREPRDSRDTRETQRDAPREPRDTREASREPRSTREAPRDAAREPRDEPPRGPRSEAPRDAPREPRRDVERDVPREPRDSRDLREPPRDAPREPAKDALRDSARNGGGSDRGKESPHGSARGSVRGSPRLSGRDLPPRSGGRSPYPPREPARERERDRERERERDSYSSRDRERERERDTYIPRGPRDSRDSRDRAPVRNGIGRDYPVREGRDRDGFRDSRDMRDLRDNYPPRDSRDERDYKRVRR